MQDIIRGITLLGECSLIVYNLNNSLNQCIPPEPKLPPTPSFLTAVSNLRRRSRHQFPVVSLPSRVSLAGHCTALLVWQEHVPREGRLHRVWVPEAAAHILHGDAGDDQPHPVHRQAALLISILRSNSHTSIKEFLFLLNLDLFSGFGCLACMWVIVSHACSTHAGQEMASGPPELELYRVMGGHVNSGKQTRVSCKSK